MLESIITPDDFNAHFLPTAENQYLLCLFLNHLWIHYPFVISSACVPPFELHEATYSKVTTRSELMDPKKAKGEDGIPVQFLRLVHLVWQDL